MTKIENKKRQKKNTLFSSAFELFTTKGFSKTSISDIVTNAGVAKGTFYLYFKDKSDILNKLIAHKAAEICKKAYNALTEEKIEDYEDRMIFFANHIIDQLAEDKMLLKFINKNLSWGILKTAIIDDAGKNEFEFDIEEVYLQMKNAPEYHFRNPDVMLFLIIELVNGACYNTILEANPVTIEEVKPHLYSAIRAIIHSQIIS